MNRIIVIPYFPHMGWLLALLVVLCCPQLFRCQTATSWLNSMTLSRTEYQAVQTVVSFTQPIYVQIPECKIGSEIKAILSPTSDISSTSKFFSLSSSGSVRLNGTISNPDVCTGPLVLMGKVIRGSTLAVSFLVGNYSRVLWDNTRLTTDFFLVFCCDEMRAAANTSSWSGSFQVKIDYSGTTQISLEAPNPSILLPYDTYYPLVPVTLACGTIAASCVGRCTVSTGPVDEPLFNVFSENIFASIGDLGVSQPTLNNTASAVVWISKTPEGSTVGADGFGYRFPSVLDGDNLAATCSVQLWWLAYEDGGPIDTSAMMPSPRQHECTYKGYQYYSEVFQLVTDTLGGHNSNFIITNPNTALLLIDYGNAVTQSFAWDSCLALAQSFLDESTLTYNDTGTYCNTAFGTPEWAADPCCNSTMQLYACCLPTTITDSFNEYEFAVPGQLSDEVVDQCTYPNCLKESLETLELISHLEYQNKCTDPATAAVADPTFQVDPWYTCFAAVYGIYLCQNDGICRANISSASYCTLADGSRKCAVPCNPTDAVPCFWGTCLLDPLNVNSNPDNVNKTYSCQNPPEDESAQFAAFAQCLLAKLDPYLGVIIQSFVQTFESSDPNAAFVDNFRNYLTDEYCNTPNGAKFLGGGDWPSPTGKRFTKEECLSLRGWCSHRSCNLDIGDATCNSLCLDPLPFRDGICGAQLSDLSLNAINRPAVCAITIQDTGFNNANASLCQMFGGSFVGAPPTSFIKYGTCLKVGSQTNGEIPTLAGCFDDKCIPQLATGTVVSLGQGCNSYCYDPTITTEGGCTGTTTRGLRRVWYSYTSQVSGAALTSCVLNGTITGVLPYNLCVSEGGTWFQGRQWLQAVYNSREACLQGSCWERSPTTLIIGSRAANCTIFRCNTCQIGTETHCYDRNLCGSVDACNSQPGCLMKIGTNLAPDGPTGLWIGRGELATVANAVCQPTNVRFGKYAIGPFPAIQNETACESYTSVCDNTNGTSPYNFQTIPKGFSYRNATECPKCGGNYIPFFKWTTGQMQLFRYPITNVFWFSLNNTVIKPTWGPRLNMTFWQNALNYAKSQRISNIYLSELVCKYGVQQHILSSVSCSCVDPFESCLEELTTLRGTPLSFLVACEGITAQSNNPTSTITVGENFTIGTSTADFECTQIEIGRIPLSQFEYRQRKLLTSLAIYSESALLSYQSIFVYNSQSPATVVGQILNNGTSFTRYENKTMSGLLACFPVTSEMLSTWQLRYPLAAISVVVSTYPFESFTPVGELYDLNTTSVCINVTGQNVTYLVAGLIDDWSSVTVDHTWPYEQLGLVIFTAIVYFLLLVWILYSLVMHLSYDYYILKDTHKSVYLKLGLLMIATQSTLRVIYFVGTPFGVFSEETLSILFSDLPQLLFHGAVVLAGVMWEAIVAEADPNMNKTHTALSYFYISTLFLAFLGLNIAYGALSPKATQQFTCGTTQEEKDQVTAAEAVGYTYRAIFALYSALIAISFSIQSFRIVQLLHKLYAKRGKQGMNHLILTFGVTSVLSICGLLIQAAIAIYSAIADLKNETKLALILTCEVLPTYALAYLMRYKAPWKAYKTFTSSHSRGSSSSKRSRQNNAPSTGSHN